MNYTLKLPLVMAALMLSACSSYKDRLTSPNSAQKYLVINGGTIITMQDDMQSKNPKHIYGKDYSVLVKDNKIEAFGKTTEVVNSIPQGSQIDYLDLNGQTLLPGFIEPHAHLQITVAGSQFADLMPCLPDKYQSIYEKGYGVLFKENEIDGKTKPCLLYLEEALNALANQGNQSNVAPWYIGNGLDPSRMKFNNHTELTKNAEFLAYPAQYIEQVKPLKTNPVFILDQSGHLAYVNQQAFKTAGICGTKFDITPQQFENKTGMQPSQEQVDFITQNQGKQILCGGTKVEMVESQNLAKFQFGFPDGDWQIAEYEEGNNDYWVFSGLLNEESAFYPLLNTLIDKIKTPSEQESDMLHVLNIASQQGVTTFTEGGGSSYEMIKSYQNMAMSPDMPTRLRTLYTWDGNLCSPDTDMNKNCHQKVPFDNAQYKGLFSAEGIKLWSDGSTQGCSASLSESYSDTGLCETAKNGHANYTKDQMVKNLSKFAKDNWYIHIHANGNQAIQNSIETFNTLAVKHSNYKQLPSVLIHSTVNGTSDSPVHIPDLIEQNRNGNVPNLSSSHLIGHVAYWGDSFKNELGDKRAKHINPTHTEWEKGIPLSLHSDMSITPLYPLWFMEQAITRRTWKYPHLNGNGIPLNKSESLSRYQALMAVTINPAMQHNIADKVGSIEVGKLADFVVLAENPMDANAVKNTDIHNIQVSCTFLNGKKVKWYKADNKDEVLNTPNCTFETNVGAKYIANLN
ncbi:hypothetical protein N474_15205 [Pseudoalteromonas luteoviolacea CPMOR-2]|uniref:amidohydrolase n=1 Tax=Pseudoalteromonas luteoviolacea TaxID=43657 RepID=UPI0007B0A49C|nr:amidohydrolase family protein [Pseudoalteromonas luteoviolacea]KZN55328.1 hypothetical protein N474_15205 [Pseudoalteromonas luteoviolacea CPMOR-2]